MLTNEQAQHIVIFGGMVVTLGGAVLGILKGWRALLDQMRAIVTEHEERERAWFDDSESRSADFRHEVLTRLSRVEGDVQSIREHLVAKGDIPPAHTPQFGWPLKP